MLRGKILLFVIITAAQGLFCGTAYSDSIGKWQEQNFPYRVKITVDSGMYSRNGFELKASVNIQQLSVKKGKWFSVVLINPRKGEIEVSGVLQSQDGSTLDIQCMIKDKLDAMESKDYFIYLKPLPKVPEDNAGNILKRGNNLVANHSFENADKSWPLFNTVYKQADISVKDATDGKKSYMVSLKKAYRGNYYCSCWSQPFPVSPGTEYSLSGHAKLLDLGHPIQHSGGCIMVALYFLDKNKKIVPFKIDRNYRDFVLWSVLPDRVKTKEILNKWLYKSKNVKSPKWAHYAKVRLSTSFVGTVLFDDICVSKIKGEKIEIKIGKMESRVPSKSKNIKKIKL